MNVSVTKALEAHWTEWCITHCISLLSLRDFQQQPRAPLHQIVNTVNP